ncbi:hypothetical protein F2P81_010372 [Scophthalmus maximus]|uniref:Uncharacterized protein n=1 Tax=Scophthalmus maximus TaxID=52904 RepID=A0A6A4SZN3_SCOMX|nr:hypothetical protein F2P81_010372 [Scophthalmus maximus]
MTSNEEMKKTQILTSDNYLYLESKVFVAFAGEDLKFQSNIIKQANHSKDTMTCFDPFHNQIYSYDIPATSGVQQHFQQIVHLNHLTSSGEYYCQFQTVKVYWFLRVRADGYQEPTILDNTEILIVAIFTSLLLVFSVVGSVYVFRGDWKEQITSCGKTDEKRQQNRGENMTRKMEDDNEDIIKPPSTSFYASLEPRTGSIYDVLEPSTANREQDQKKTKPRNDEPQKTVSVNLSCFVTFSAVGGKQHMQLMTCLLFPPQTEQTRKQQDDDAFESVYENF